MGDVEGSRGYLVKETPGRVVNDRYHLAGEESREWVSPLGRWSQGRGEKWQSVWETRSRALEQRC